MPTQFYGCISRMLTAEIVMAAYGQPGEPGTHWRKWRLPVAQKTADHVRKFERRFLRLHFPRMSHIRSSPQFCSFSQSTGHYITGRLGAHGGVKLAIGP